MINLWSPRWPSTAEQGSAAPPRQRRTLLLTCCWKPLTRVLPGADGMSGAPRPPDRWRPAWTYSGRRGRGPLAFQILPTRPMLRGHGRTASRRHWRGKNESGIAIAGGRRPAVVACSGRCPTEQTDPCGAPVGEAQPKRGQWGLVVNLHPRVDVVDGTVRPSTLPDRTIGLDEVCNDAAAAADRQMLRVFAGRGLLTSTSPSLRPGPDPASRAVPPAP